VLSFILLNLNKLFIKFNTSLFRIFAKLRSLNLSKDYFLYQFLYLTFNKYYINNLKIQ